MKNIQLENPKGLADNRSYTLWPRRLLEQNMHLTADENYKVWVVMQASEPSGLSKYKRTQVLMNESQKNKQKRH